MLGEVYYPFPITSWSRTVRIREENGLAPGHMASCRPGPSPRFLTDGTKLFLGPMSNCWGGRPGHSPHLSGYNHTNSRNALSGEGPEKLQLTFNMTGPTSKALQLDSNMGDETANACRSCRWTVLAGNSPRPESGSGPQKPHTRRLPHRRAGRNMRNNLSSVCGSMCY